MLSQTMEYALRAVVFLAHEAPLACTTDQIALATNVPKAYLSKVLQGLVHNGIVNSQRGLGGGMALAKLATTLTVWDVVEAVDPIPRIGSCPLEPMRDMGRLCALHRCLEEATDRVATLFRMTTLADLLINNNDDEVYCRFPSVLPTSSRSVAEAPSSDFKARDE